MDIQKITAKNIKTVREQKKITLDAAAKLTGVSRSMLAQIEKGDVNPTISVIWKIANGYKVSFTSLVEDSEQPAMLIRRNDTVPLSENAGKYLNYPAFPFSDDRHFETYMIEIELGGYLNAQPHIMGAEEYITVFDGTIRIQAGEESFVLTSGDSLMFKGDKEHTYENIGESHCRLHMIIYYNQ